MRRSLLSSPSSPIAPLTAPASLANHSSFLFEKVQNDELLGSEDAIKALMDGVEHVRQHQLSSFIFHPGSAFVRVWRWCVIALAVRRGVTNLASTVHSTLTLHYLHTPVSLANLISLSLSLPPHPIHS